MIQEELDNLFMSRCLNLASLGGVSVAPNPMVGCVIVVENEIIGEGFHEKYGDAHAEVNAFNSLKETAKIKDATVYVNLEPCSHFGKTPPCVNLILSQKPKRVVIANLDPNPLVAGNGIKQLKDAGIDTIVGVLEMEGRELNKRFFTFHEKKRPYILLKWAQTPSGFMDRLRSETNETGVNWISKETTKLLVHTWRSENAAILVGWKTIRNDNPSLTVRSVVGKNPLRIVLDRNLHSPSESTIFQDNEPLLVFTQRKREDFSSKRFIDLEDFTLDTILKKLYDSGINSVFVEGGKNTLETFLSSGLWDEAYVIKGQNEFEDGLKAPVVTKLPSNTFSFKGDVVYHFKN
jgi:diaminohydroxyphosphoribosylaminopyrimidine deaminase/5-amino-6-(5-phosphoribosylamino)uracil reductase